MTVLGRRPDRRGICPGLATSRNTSRCIEDSPSRTYCCSARRPTPRGTVTTPRDWWPRRRHPLSARVKTLSPGHRAASPSRWHSGGGPTSPARRAARGTRTRSRGAPWCALMEDAAERGTPSCCRSHVLSEVAEIADRLIILGAGRVRLSGALDDLLDELTCSAAPVTRTASSARRDRRVAQRTHLVRGPAPRRLRRLAHGASEPRRHRAGLPDHDRRRGSMIWVTWRQFRDDDPGRGRGNPDAGSDRADLRDDRGGNAPDHGPR